MGRLIKNAYIRESDKVLDNYTMTMLYVKCCIAKEMVDDLENTKHTRNISKSDFNAAVYKAINVFVQLFIDKNINAARKVIARWIRRENIHINPATMGGEEMSEKLLSHLHKNGSETTVQSLAACFDDNALDDLFRFFMQILLGSGGYSISSMNTKMGKSFLHYIASYPLTSKAFLSFVEKMAKSDDGYIPPFYTPELYDASRVDKEGNPKFDDEQQKKDFEENREILVKRHELLTDKFDKVVSDDVKINSSGNTLDMRSIEWRNKADDEIYPSITDASMQEDVVFGQAIFSNYPTKMSNDNPVVIIEGEVRSAGGDPSANVKAWAHKNGREPNNYVTGFLTPDKKSLFVSEFKGAINWPDIKRKLSLIKIYQLYDNNIVKKVVKTRRLAKKI